MLTRQSPVFKLRQLSPLSKLRQFPHHLATKVCSIAHSDNVDDTEFHIQAQTASSIETRTASASPREEDSGPHTQAQTDSTLPCVDESHIHAQTATGNRRDKDSHIQALSSTETRSDTRLRSPSAATAHTCHNMCTPPQPPNGSSPSFLNPARPNTYPLFQVYTPLPRHLYPHSTLISRHWELLLQNYPDSSFKQIITGIATFGARIGYTGRPSQIQCTNHKSALEIQHDINDNITDELKLGRIAKLDKLPASYISSPIGAVEKRQNGVFVGWH